jgi:hypothetical protein
MANAAKPKRIVTKKDARGDPDVISGSTGKKRSATITPGGRIFVICCN